MSTGAAALKSIKAFALALPGAAPKSPWPGHDDVAVNDKTFVYLSVHRQTRIVTASAVDPEQPSLRLLRQHGQRPQPQEIGVGTEALDGALDRRRDD